MLIFLLKSLYNSGYDATVPFDKNLALKKIEKCPIENWDDALEKIRPLLQEDMDVLSKIASKSQKDIQ